MIVLNSNIIRLVMFLGIVSIILSLIKYSNIATILMIILFFYILFDRIYCSLYGACYFSVYLNFILVVLFAIFLILDYFGILNKYKKSLKSLFVIYEENSNSSLKKTLFPKKKDLSNYYKKKISPNRHLDDDEDEDDEDDEDEINNIKNDIYTKLDTMKKNCSKIYRKN